MPFLCVCVGLPYSPPGSREAETKRSQRTYSTVISKPLSANGPQRHTLWEVNLQDISATVHGCTSQNPLFCTEGAHYNLFSVGYLVLPAHFRACGPAPPDDHSLPATFIPSGRKIKFALNELPPITGPRERIRLARRSRVWCKVPKAIVRTCLF